jgi:uncharacterized ferritin-like protein (DUF455 family)
MSTDAQSGPLTVEEWARLYIECSDLSGKISPALPPKRWAPDRAPLDPRPGRPPELEVSLKKPRTFKQGALVRAEARAALHHKFWHHELQAAELMCWALLRFPDTPQEFREGLLRIFRDEVRHMGMYQAHIESLGFALGDYPVRDWFWERIPTCETPVQFVALLGMGLEGANLDHTARFSTWLRSVGDLEGATIQEQVGREEVAHVRFATRWFRAWTGDVDFDEWCAALPEPLTPLLMRGKTLQMEPRLKAEFPQAFLTSLERWEPEPHKPSP